MKFRPCIDIHNGAVKQIVGESLSEEGVVSNAKDNFVSSDGAAKYAQMFKLHNLTGGHVVMLNKPGDEKYEATLKQCHLALSEYPGGLQVGGGINDKNAQEFLDAGASHVIVTSFVFKDGKVDMEKAKALEAAVGADKIVLDLSVKRVGDNYHVATDRWQKISEEPVHLDLLERLSPYCCEFLIHAADVEGKRNGIDEELITRLSDWDGHVITYAGGITTIKDIQNIWDISNGKIDFTVGSALDIYGGGLKFGDIIKVC